MSLLAGPVLLLVACSAPSPDTEVFLPPARPSEPTSVTSTTTFPSTSTTPTPEGCDAFAAFIDKIGYATLNDALAAATEGSVVEVCPGQQLTLTGGIGQRRLLRRAALRPRPTVHDPRPERRVRREHPVVRTSRRWGAEGAAGAPPGALGVVAEAS